MLSPAAVLDAVSGAEFDLWCRFYGRHPFGPKGESVRAGVVAAAMAGGRPADYFPGLLPPRAGSGSWAAWARARCPALTAPDSW